jgi:hypothetical protein
MRPVMIAMGSLLLAGNLLFAVPVRQNTVQLRNAEQADLEIRRGVEEALESRGVETEEVQRMVSEHFGSAGTKHAHGFAHFTLLFPDIRHSAVVSYVAERVLRKEAFAFDNYDHLVAMLQRISGPSLASSHYDRLRHCVLLNRSLIRSQSPQAVPA